MSLEVILNIVKRVRLLNKSFENTTRISSREGWTKSTWILPITWALEFNQVTRNNFCTIYIILFRQKRIRYKGDCICRLPLLSPNDPINEDHTLAEEKCKKCEKLRIRVEDFVIFGTSVDDVMVLSSICSIF